MSVKFRKFRTLRDPAIMTGGESALVVACDSIGGIGSKTLDRVKANARLVGRFAVRVPLMEVLSLGAEPFCVSVSICVEPEPTGGLILKGVSDELCVLDLNEKMTLVSSSEKNVKTRQTAVGVTMLGQAKTNDIRIGRCRRGDIVVAIGRPCVGREVLRNDRKGLIADLWDVQKLFGLPYVHECIPAGSKGVFHEARVLERDSRVRFIPNSVPERFEKSAGPATCILASLEVSGLHDLKRRIRKPITEVGRFR